MNKRAIARALARTTLGLTATVTLTVIPAYAETDVVSEKEQAVARSPIAKGEYTSCRPTTTPLVFDGGYQVSMCYETAEGVVGEAQGGIWASGQSGLLWFFDPDNAEVLVKVLDGCSHNGRRWIFVAPVTDVAFNLHITSNGGSEWTHRNPLSQTAVTRSDTSAFDCATGERPGDDGHPGDDAPVWGDFVRTANDGLYFSGPLAIEAFHAAGGRRYRGSKVPLADRAHWRVPVLTGELMGPYGGEALSAITVQALADIGYGVKLSQADQYTLPASVATAPEGRAGTRDCGKWPQRCKSTTTTESATIRPPPLVAVSADSESDNLIPDAALRSAIRTALGLPSSTTIAQDHLESLTRLTARNAGIRSLKGLARATNLTFLDLRDNEIANLSPLAGLIKLNWLNLAVNKISEVSPLAELINLTVLNLSFNGEARAAAGIPDVSPLAGLTNLRALYLDHNRISDVSPLAELTNLNTLFLQWNRISDVSPLAQLTSLRGLFLASNAIQSVSPLARLTRLTSLHLSGNAIHNVSPLGELTNLHSLFLHYNRISDPSPLARLTYLNALDLEGNSVSDASLLAGLTNLKELSLPYNLIEHVSPLARLTSLNKLDLAWNLISDVSPLAELANLRELELRGNPLSRASLSAHVPALLSRGIEVSFDDFRKGDFDIEVVLLGDGWSTDRNRIHRQRIEWSVRRWMAIISDDLPDHVFTEPRSGRCGGKAWEISAGERIDDLRVYVASFKGGPRDPVGYGGPDLLRQNGLPISGCMVLDLERGNIPILASHELGHVLGLGTFRRTASFASLGVVTKPAWEDGRLLRDDAAPAPFCGVTGASEPIPVVGQ